MAARRLLTINKDASCGDLGGTGQKKIEWMFRDGACNGAIFSSTLDRC